jgi:hypothetical protein
VRVGRVAMVLAVICVALSARPALAAQPEEGSHQTLIMEVYTELLLRLPSSDEVSEWGQRISESGMSEEEVYAHVRASREYSRIHRKRRLEAKRIAGSSIAFLGLCGVIYLLVVRKRPERRLLFLLFVFLVTPVFLHYDYAFRKAHFGDLPTFHASADYVYNQHRSPYGNGMSEDLDAQIFPLFHPPPFLAIFYPLSLVSLETAKDLVVYGNQIALLLVLYLLILHGRDEPLVVPVCLLVYMLNFYPSWLTLQLGQTNFWTTLFICLFMEAYVRRRSSSWLGLTLAGAIVWKAYPGLLFGYLALKRKWAAMAWCVGGLGLCVVVGLLTIPWETWESWWANVGSRAAYGEKGPVGLFSPAGPWNQGFNGIFQRLFTNNEFTVAIYNSPFLGTVVTYVLSALFLGGGIALIWLRDRRGWTGEDELEMGFVLSIMSVIVPLSWLHQSVLLLPAIAAGTRYLFKHPRGLTVVIFCLSTFAVAWDWTLLPTDLRLFLGGYSVLLGSVVGVARVGVVFCLGQKFVLPRRGACASD